MPTGWIHAINRDSNPLTKDVVYLQTDIVGPGQPEIDHRSRIERVWIVLK
jgi:hypothetical protein